MKASEVWTSLVTTLKNDTTLSRYIKNIFELERFNIEPESFPCIMLEPVQDNEIERDMNQIKNLFFTVNLFAFSSSSVQDFKKSIVGDAMYKGILDITNDIRTCLTRNNTLSGDVIDIQIGIIQYDTLDTNKYPVRGLIMPLKILYRQNNCE